MAGNIAKAKARIANKDMEVRLLTFRNNYAL